MSSPMISKTKRILLAEDNEINMEIAVEFLTMLGAKVTSAWNGREAVETFLSSAPGFLRLYPDGYADA